MPNETSSHYLVGHFTTHQPDGVHVEAHCTCGEKLEGVGENESAAMSALWTIFLLHRKEKPRKVQKHHPADFSASDEVFAPGITGFAND